MSQTGQQADSGARRVRSKSNNSLIFLIALVAIVVLVTGAGLASSSSSGFQDSCITATQTGNTLTVSTTGIIHHLGSKYYIGCSEGDSGSTSPSSVSCLTVTPQYAASPYPSSAGAYLYYLSAQGGTIALQGAPANATVITQPTIATILVTCG